jgi:ribosomal protein S6--L-glutamate ligase
MKLAVISLQSKSSEMLVEASKKYFDQVDSIDLKQIEVIVKDKAEVIYEGKPLQHYDCVYCRGSSKYVLLLRSITEILYDESYMPLKPESFTIGHDKFLTQLGLQKQKVDMPRTYLAATTDKAKEIIARIHYPAIIKLPSGTHGKGVMFADSRDSASSILDTLEIFKQAYIIQEFVDTDGTDVRVFVVGNKVVASMRRKAAKGDKRSNLHSGGQAESLTLDYSTEQLAIKSSKAINADVSGVDILQGASPLVIEVNTSPGLQGITTATKVDVADKIAKFLHKKTSEFSSSKKKTHYSDILKEINKPSGSKEIITNLDMKLGKIRLDSTITKMTGFSPEDEVAIVVDKGKIIIEKHK